MTAREFSRSYRLAVRLLRPPLTATTRRDWRGAENLPTDSGFVACSNHVSEIDPLTLAHFLVDHGWPPRFLAKQAVFEVPVIGRIITGAGQIPVKRNSTDAALSSRRPWKPCGRGSASPSIPRVRSLAIPTCGR